MGRINKTILVILLMLSLTIPIVAAEVIIDSKFPFIHILPDEQVVDYKYTYENNTYLVPIWDLIEYDIPSVWSEKNQSMTKAERVLRSEIVGYKSVSSYEKRKGIEIDGVQREGYFNFDENTLCEWKFDIGDRNFEEFPCCLPYEEEKGVCVKTELYRATPIK